MTTFKDGRYYRKKDSDTVIYVKKNPTCSVGSFFTSSIIHRNNVPIGTISYIFPAEAILYEEVTVEVVDNKIIVKEVKELERLANLSFNDTFTVPKFDGPVVYKTMAYLRPPGCSVGVFMIQDVAKCMPPTLVAGDTMVYIVSKGD